MTHALDHDGRIPEIGLGLRLEIARRDASLSQLQLATAIDAGLSTIQRAERGATKPRRPVLLAWAMATGVSLQWLETGSNYRSEGWEFESLRAHNLAAVAA